ncbi:MAG: DUF1800 domain-containing protein, partial [Planctomycetota bacterium]|nr:DUF1800 domain-containing protein [Planctomycetota bacterium]
WLGAVAVDDPLATSNGWSKAHAGHLLRRAGFGGTPEQIDFLASLGREKAVGTLVDYEAVADTGTPFELPPPPPPIRQTHPNADKDEIQRLRGLERRADRIQFERVAGWWLSRMVSSPRPLQEKMTLFWHGHFTSGYREVRSSRAMHLQNDLFRRLATGSFRELLMDISEDPAMILYLNTQQNSKRKPNENFARELLELFTMGVGHYTENDIKEAARAFTGVRLDRRTCKVSFRRRQHDFGEKTFLGKTGNFEPSDVIDIILDQPVTAEFMSRKMWEFFAYEDPEPAIVKALASVFRESKYDVGALLQAMFRSDAFYSDRARFTHIKSPVELIVGTMRALETPVFNDVTLLEHLRSMGHTLLQPPNVKGWDGGIAWINSSTLFNRYNAPMHIVFGNDNARFRRALRRRMRQLEETLGAEAPVMMGMGPENIIRAQPAYDPIRVIVEQGLSSAEAVVDHFVERLLQRSIEPARRKSLIEVLERKIDARSVSRPSNADGIRAVIHLILSMPEYQLS